MIKLPGMAKIKKKGKHKDRDMVSGLHFMFLFFEFLPFLSLIIRSMANQKQKIVLLVQSRILRTP